MRVPRVVEMSELFLAAVAYTATGEAEATFKISNYLTVLTEVIEKPRDTGKKVVTAKETAISNTAVLNRIKQEDLPEFARLVLDLHILLLTLKRPKYSYSPAAREICRLCGVKDVCMIDGTYITVRKSSKYECRAGDGKSGLALHCLTSLQSGTIVGLEITQGACNERLHVPTKKLVSAVLLADRGYPSFEVFYELMERDLEHNVKFLFRAVPCFKMTLLRATNLEGKEVLLKSFDADVDTSDSANHAIDILAKFHRPRGCKAPAKELTMRAVRVFRPHDGTWIYFITNIPASQLQAATCPYVYKLRWVCEQIYKCAKSYTSMARGINSTHFNVVLFFIVASICAMILRTVMASYMRTKDGRLLSMLKVHERLRNLTALVKAINNACATISVFGLLRAKGRAHEKSCVLSHASERDKKKVAVFSAVLERILAIENSESSNEAHA